MNNRGLAAAWCRTVFNQMLLCRYVWSVSISDKCSFLNAITLFFSPFHASCYGPFLNGPFPVEDHNCDMFFFVNSTLKAICVVLVKAVGQRLSHRWSTIGASGAAARLRSSAPRISIKIANHSMWSDDQICQNRDGAALVLQALNAFSMLPLQAHKF